MPAQPKFAVVLVRHSGTRTPRIQACRTLMTDGPVSVAQYWRENSAGWFDMAADYYGPYRVSIPADVDRQTGHTQRRSVYKIACDAAIQQGAGLSGYDAVVVLLAPGGNYDAGQIGNGALLPATADHTFYCHEIGHVLGFDHTYGIPNLAADWDGTGVRRPVYGDPYDLMSSAWGELSKPQTTAIASPVPGFPNTGVAGPMVSRALLHHQAPDALEAGGRVAHVQAGEGRTIVLSPAGSTTGTELVVFHPEDEDGEHRGRVYVELRQPSPNNVASRWDGGLATDGASVHRRGLVIHTIKDVPGESGTRVWYVGRIVFPNPDVDVEVPTALGRVTLHVDESTAAQDEPQSAQVWFKRSKPVPRVRIEETLTPTMSVVATEMRSIPGWDFAGEFTWETRDVTLEARYRPVIRGLGGESPHERVSNLTMRWYVGGFMVTGMSGTHLVGSKPLSYQIDGDDQVLTLTNNPADGSFDASVEFVVDDGRSYSSATKYSVDGRTEGWGQDYHDYMAIWDRVTNPIPQRVYGPPRPDDYRDQLDALWLGYNRLRDTNEEAATRLQPWVAAHAQLLQELRWLK